MDGGSSARRMREEVALGILAAGKPESVAIDDVPVNEVWERLKSDPNAVLVDVRTRAEWAFVGLPDLTDASKKAVLVEWQTFPDNAVDLKFAERLGGVLSSSGVGQSAEIFFICRSGGRSKSAAIAMAAMGYSRCRNVADGFEGPLDAQRHRGRTGGWKSSGLPWAQG